MKRNIIVPLAGALALATSLDLATAVSAAPMGIAPKAAVATPAQVTDVQYRYRRYGYRGYRRGWGGPAVGLGILGGVAAGAIVGSAIANSYGPAYVVQPGYVPYAAYGGPVPVGCPGGYWARMPVYDPYGNVVGYRGRPRYFCP